MIERIAIQHAKMKGVEWSCVSEDPKTAGLSIPGLNWHLSQLPIGHGAWIQFYPDPISPVYGWLYLIPAGGWDGVWWATERIGPFSVTNKPWENFLDFRDFLGEKLPGLALSWKAYNESNLWC
jgi:hypothetical protein